MISWWLWKNRLQKPVRENRLQKPVRGELGESAAEAIAGESASEAIADAPVIDADAYEGPDEDVASDPLATLTTDPSLGSLTTDPSLGSSTTDPSLGSSTTDPSLGSSTTDPSLGSSTTGKTTFMPEKPGAGAHGALFGSFVSLGDPYNIQINRSPGEQQLRLERRRQIMERLEMFLV